MRILEFESSAMIGWDAMVAIWVGESVLDP